MSAPLHPLASLKAVIREALLADAGVAALLGAAIHDAPPRGLKPPCLVLGDARAEEAGTGEADAAILELELVVVTGERGSAQALAIAGAVRAALAGVLPAPEGHRLVSLMPRGMATRHDAATDITRASLRYRAFLEPI